MWSYRKSVALAAITIVALASGAYLYNDRWVPARDLNALGVPEIRPWTSRFADRVAWFGGSQVTYVYRISLDTEERLRRRCRSEVEKSLGPNAMCYFANQHLDGAADISAAVGRRSVFLYYTGG
jgi:hypothetical protein